MDKVSERMPMMNEQNSIHPFVEQLLAGEKVEWKTLGEVCEVVTDFTAAGSFASNAKNVVYLKKIDFALLVRTTDLKSKFSSPESFVYVNQKAFDYLWRVNLDKEGIILPNVGNCGEVYFFDPLKSPYKKCVLGPNALLLRSSSVIQKYLYYVFQGHDFQARLLKITSTTGQTKFNKTNLKTLLLPIPPLHVQRKLVEVLDKFTELEAELEAELEVRKKQYAYYREKLLSFETLREGVKCDICYLPLGEVGTFVRGNGLQKKDLIEAGVPAIHYGQIYTHYGTCAEQTKSFVSSEVAKPLRKVNYGDVIFTNTSENIEDVCKALVYHVCEEGVIGGHACIFKPSPDVLGQYLVYYTQTHAFMQMKRAYAKGTKVIDVSATDLAKIRIPVPPLAEQERIVSILDRFERLAYSLTEGLPREVALRRKQYAYYREALLRFPQ